MRGLLAQEEVAGVRKPLGDASWLPARAYSDPAVAAAEFERIFKREWQEACLLEQVRHPGTYLATEVMRQPILIVHCMDGEIRAFYNVCRHRGMKIAEGSGKAETFTCPYHRWCYGIDGKLISAPEMDKTHGFDVSKVELKPLRTEVWQGFVCINFDPDAEALAPRLRDLEELIAPWNITELRIAYEALSEPLPKCNWKTMIENGIEGYHVMGPHASSGQPRIPAERTYTTDQPDGSLWADLHHPYSDLALSEYSSGSMPPALPGLPEWGHHESVFFFVWGGGPNFSVTSHGVTAYSSVRDAEGRSRSVWRFLVPESTLAWSGLDDFLERTSKSVEQINAEDFGVCEGAAQGISSLGWEPCRYSHLEKPVWQFHRWYADRMSE